MAFLFLFFVRKYVRVSKRSYINKYNIVAHFVCGGNDTFGWQVTMNGPTATDWNGAYYNLEVGTTIPGQVQPTGKIIRRGTIKEVFMCVCCLMYRSILL